MSARSRCLDVDDQFRIKAWARRGFLCTYIVERRLLISKPILNVPRTVLFHSQTFTLRTHPSLPTFCSRWSSLISSPTFYLFPSYIYIASLFSFDIKTSTRSYPLTISYVIPRSSTQVSSRLKHHHHPWRSSSLCWSIQTWICQQGSKFLIALCSDQCVHCETTCSLIKACVFLGLLRCTLYVRKGGWLAEALWNQDIDIEAVDSPASNMLLWFRHDWYSALIKSSEVFQKRRRISQPFVEFSKRPKHYQMSYHLCTVRKMMSIFRKRCCLCWVAFLGLRSSSLPAIDHEHCGLDSAIGLHCYHILARDDWHGIVGCMFSGIFVLVVVCHKPFSMLSWSSSRHRKSTRATLRMQRNDGYKFRICPLTKPSFGLSWGERQHSLE